MVVLCGSLEWGLLVVIHYPVLVKTSGFRGPLAEEGTVSPLSSASFSNLLQLKFFTSLVSIKVTASFKIPGDISISLKMNLIHHFILLCKTACWWLILKCVLSTAVKTVKINLGGKGSKVISASSFRMYFWNRMKTR